MKIHGVVEKQKNENLIKRKSDETEPFIEELRNAKSRLSSNNSRIDNIIHRNAAKYNLPADLVFAVAETESGFNNNAVSKAGARGIMQLMPCAVKHMKIKDPYSLEGNIEGGTKMLRYLMDRYNNNMKAALAAYNGGIGRVDKNTGYCSCKGANNYANKVLSKLNGSDFKTVTVSKGRENTEGLQKGVRNQLKYTEVNNFIDRAKTMDDMQNIIKLLIQSIIINMKTVGYSQLNIQEVLNNE